MNRRHVEAILTIVLALGACGPSRGAPPAPATAVAEPPQRPALEAGAPTLDGGTDASHATAADEDIPKTDCSRGALTPGTVVIEERQHTRTEAGNLPDEKITLRKQIRSVEGAINVRVTLVAHENTMETVIVTPVEQSYVDLIPCTKEGESRCLGKSEPLFDGFEGNAYKTALMVVEDAAAFQPLMFEQAPFFREAASPTLKPGAKMPSFKQVILHLTDYSERSGTVTTTFAEERNEPWGAMRVFKARISLREHFAAMGQSAIVQTDGTATALVRAADGAPIEIDIQSTERKTYTRFKAPTEVHKTRFRISRPCFRTPHSG